MCSEKNKDWEAALITGLIALVIAFGGNYLLTTNKVSGMETKVDVYQQSIQDLSIKMDKLNNSINLTENQVIQLREDLKMKQDKFAIK